MTLGEERLLFDVKEEEGFQNNAAGGERLGSIKREFQGDDVDELMKLQSKDEKKGVEKVNEDICLSCW